MNIDNIPTELPGNLQSPNKQSDNGNIGPLSSLLSLLKQRIYNVEHMPPGTHVMVVAICPNAHHVNTIYIPEIFGGYFFNHYIKEFLDLQECRSGNI